MSKKKKKTRRSKLKYPTLNLKYNTKVRQEYLDYDYIDSLSDEEKQFLDDFNKEYYCATLGKQRDKGKNNRFVNSENYTDVVKEMKEIQHQNYARTMDVYGNVRNKVGATHIKRLNEVDPFSGNFITDSKKYRSNIDNNNEDAIIELIDRKIKSDKSK